MVENKPGEEGKIFGFFKHKIGTVVSTSHTYSENQRRKCMQDCFVIDKASCKDKIPIPSMLAVDFGLLFQECPAFVQIYALVVFLNKVANCQ